jgi:hypothetical protein
MLCASLSLTWYTLHAQYVVTIIAPDPTRTNVFKCIPPAWSIGISQYGTIIPCRTSFTLQETSVVFGHFTGHTYVANNWVYEAVTVRLL